MAEKDTILALLGAAIAIAGLVLVYSGFVLARAAAFSDVRKRRKYECVAKCGLVPVLAALSCALLAIRALRPGHWGAQWASNWIILAFEIVLALTGGYAIIAALFGS
jgi:putative flippase GtrA